MNKYVGCCTHYNVLSICTLLPYKVALHSNMTHSILFVCSVSNLARLGYLNVPKETHCVMGR